MFNYFFKSKKDIEQENTINALGSGSKEIIDNFIKLTGDTQKRRSKDFSTLKHFVLDSEQWLNSELRLKDDEDDVALVFNFSQEYIERYMARLFPRNPHTGVLEVGVKVTGDNAEQNNKYEKEILDIYKEYDLANMLLEQGVDYLCCGDACFFYPLDPITKRAKIISINPADCFLGWSNNRLVQFAYKEYQGDGKYKTIYYDLNNIIIHDELTDKYKRTENKFDFIPFSWIPNFPKPHTHEGIPKTTLLMEFDRLYNRNSSSFDKRIEENTEPHILIKSDMANISKIERGRKKKTRLGANDDMQYLELKEGQEIIDWLNLIEKRITNKTGIVHSAGEVKGAVSGKSLSFQYSDMMDLIGFMRLNWDKAFRELNNAILSYKYKISIYKTDPVYQPFLIQDNSDRIDEYATMIENNLISHKDAIDELRGVENAEEKLNEILEEKKLFDKIEVKGKLENNFNNQNG